GSNPTRPTISKIWKAHENADFQIFFCVADCQGGELIGFHHGVDATSCKVVGQSLEYPSIATPKLLCSRLEYRHRSAWSYSLCWRVHG
ncbi:hypothetical protein, partial [Pseudomonas viridiflava]|uniref:hypothetical protein n=1 Tax=Pseudomonas viridiflava TaxID=33069 RepID=UPI001F2AC666